MPPDTMKAVVITRPGDPEVLEIRDVPVPEAGREHLRVRIHAFGINRAELLQRRGLYPAPPGFPQDIPGLEYAGEVEAIGPGAGSIAVGDRVMGIAGGGAYAEYVVTPAAHAISIPDGLSFDEAAAVPEAFLTAFDALDRLAVVAGEWVLVHAIGSGVGTATLQLVGALNARCIGTSRNASKLARARELGMEAGINTSSEDLAPIVRKMTGAGVNAAVDLVGGPLFTATLEAMAPRGRVILVGLTGGRRVDLDLGLILRRRLRIEGTVLRSRPDDEKSQLVRSFIPAVLPGFGDGRLRPVIDRVFPFEEIREAHKYVEADRNFGKVIVRVTGKK